MKMLVVAMGAMFAVSACGKKEGEAAGGGAAAGGGNLPANCAKLVDTAKACFEKAGDAGKTAAQGFDQGIKALEEAAKADAGAADTQCKAMFDQMKGSMGAICPDVKWE